MIVPAVPALQNRIEQAARDCGLGHVLQIIPGQSHTALAACDVTLIASGTATLEAALFKRPMVIAYRMHPLELAPDAPRNCSPGWAAQHPVPRICRARTACRTMPHRRRPLLVPELIQWFDARRSACPHGGAASDVLLCCRDACSATPRHRRAPMPSRKSLPPRLNKPARHGILHGLVAGGRGRAGPLAGPGGGRCRDPDERQPIAGPGRIPRN